MTDSTRSPQPLLRVPSGVPGLDAILQGGFFQGGLYLLMGRPGTGKTILGNQIAFNQAAQGNRVVYLTLLAETHARMLAHLQSLNFFDPSPIADALYYVSGYRVLEQEGLDGLLQLLRRVVRDHKANLLILDGVITAESVASSDLLFKRFIHELQVYIEVTNCTTFLLTQTDPQNHHPEHTMVDGLIELTDQRVGLRSVRELEVRKFRGSASLRGKHIFDITNAGITIYPRLETLHAIPSQIPQEDTRKVSTGIKGLDEMLHGGFNGSSSSLLLGAPGSGKTNLGLQFLMQGVRENEAGLILGFYESPARLMGKARAIGLDLADAARDGQLEIMWQPPTEDTLDTLTSRMLDTIERKQIKRVFIDGLNAMRETSTAPERMTRFFSVLTNELRGRGITALLSAETRLLFGPSIETPFDGVSSIVENIIFLRFVELRSQLYRLISILKMRESAHDSTIREFTITDKGIEVANSFESAEAILTGIGITPPSGGTPSPKPRRRKQG